MADVWKRFIKWAKRKKKFCSWLEKMYKVSEEEIIGNMLEHEGEYVGHIL